ncbi:type III-B CRISPR-associated protein Cas10/Cmr2 [Phormidium sp. CCY1219]|uniref:type III-B CRISPR-associated protein Cas10/Cmr2 n=1 Tax=Phormidium sp. CCY1219 TaxID=2886104 RepID=UPI002D1F107E|nr:type III-B CRISPR-associated protein Cas10/Cmr2 [Phormidium sp. CCY1219]MEB3827774.1 hypothetical protein [Phormidium sp. CCY1219]
MNREESRSDNRQYVLVTFAPIQGFIEKSRKLRDLYGASLILSYLSRAIIQAAQEKGVEVISPGLPKIAKGMPNRILLRGDFPEETARHALLDAWGKVLEQCRRRLEEKIAREGAIAGNSLIPGNPNGRNGKSTPGRCFGDKEKRQKKPNYS